MEITIEQIKTFSPDLISELNNLLTQLNPDSKMLNEKDVKEIIGNQLSHVLVARESVNHKIVGMVTLAIYRIPAWKKAWIEDVVVDKEYRNNGIATKLINYAIADAKSSGVFSLNLTSRPERENANKLYAKMGFKKRDTNVYRLEI